MIFFIASWVDDQQLNYVNVALTAPGRLILNISFWVAINKSSVHDCKTGQECRGLNRDWDFNHCCQKSELSTLDSQIG